MKILKFFFGAPYRLMLSMIIFLCIYFAFFEMDTVQDWIDNFLNPFTVFGEKAPQYVMFGLVMLGMAKLFSKK